MNLNGFVVLLGGGFLVLCGGFLVAIVMVSLCASFDGATMVVTVV